VEARLLDWADGRAAERVAEEGRFDVVLGSDLVFASNGDVHGSLAELLKKLLGRPGAVCVLAHERRDESVDEAFFGLLKDGGLVEREVEREDDGIRLVVLEGAAPAPAAPPPADPPPAITPAQAVRDAGLLLKKVVRLRGTASVVDLPAGRIDLSEGGAKVVVSLAQAGVEGGVEEGAEVLVEGRVMKKARRTFFEASAVIEVKRPT
jgi:hypothetical protein